MTVSVYDESGAWTSGANYPDSVYLGSAVGYVEVTEDANVGHLYSIAGITRSGLETECYEYNVGIAILEFIWFNCFELPAKKCENPHEVHALPSPSNAHTFLQLLEHEVE